MSPTQFPDVQIIIASNEVGVFALEMSSSTVSLPGANSLMGREEIRMEDLLQAQFENELNLQLWNGMATFSINMLIHQINKSECDVGNCADPRILFLLTKYHAELYHAFVTDSLRI